jgi:quinol monooxygenase YgiN
MLLLLAELNAKPSAAEEVEGILRGLVDVTRRENGNLAYAVHRQQADRNAFVLYELYKDRAACDVHLASEPVQQALKRFDALLAAAPRIVFCDTVSAAGIA